MGMEGEAEEEEGEVAEENEIEKWKEFKGTVGTDLSLQKLHGFVVGALLAVP